MARVLVIGDTHFPAVHKNYFTFIKKIRDKYKCNEFMHIGDVVDHHCISFHAKHPENEGAVTEYKKAMSTINPTKNKDKVISITYLAGIPVACAFTDSRPLTQLFVRKALRRQGIGSKLFGEHWKWWTRNVRTDYKYFQPTVYAGVDGSEKFWQYMGVEVG